MCSEKQKIIQKRVAKRERYARMARIRYRKQKNVQLARPEVLAGFEKCTDEKTQVHELCPGIFFGERNGTIESEASMLNKNYLANCITCLTENNTKFLRLKLCKSTSKRNIPSPEELDEMEKRENKCWAMWAQRFRGFFSNYKNFIEKHKSFFETGKMSNEQTQRYNEFQKLRKEIVTKKACIEIKTRFNAVEDYISELVYNSRYLEGLGYEVEEFVEKILREGIPRILYTENTNGMIMKNMMENFESLFEKPFEFTCDELETRLLGNNQQMRTGTMRFVIAGYFYKGKAELSYLLILENPSLLPENRVNVSALAKPIVKKEILENVEGKSFLEKYYKDQLTTFHDVETAASDAGLSTKLESEDTRIKEEICEERTYNVFDHNLVNNRCMANGYIKDNIVLTPPEGSLSPNMNNVPNVSAEILQKIYNMQMQSYMMLTQCNLLGAMYKSS